MQDEPQVKERGRRGERGGCASADRTVLPEKSNLHVSVRGHPYTLSFFYKGLLIRDGNMRLVEISKILGMETSLIEKLRDGGNLLISQAPSLRDNNILIICTSFGAELL